VSAYRCTLTLADALFYGHCAHRTTERETDDLELGCLRRAVVLGSPVRPGTHEAFVRRFQPAGLGPSVLLPAYARTEASGILALGRPGAAPLAERFDRRSLGLGSFVCSAGMADGRGRIMMSSGLPLRGIGLRITGSEGEVLDEGRVGQLEFEGQACAKEEQSAAGFVATGELGFLAQGELFVVGEHEEGFELDGLRFDPSEFEAVASEVPGIRPAGAVAFAVPDELADSNQPILMASADRSLGPQRREDLAVRLGTRVGRMIGIRPKVFLVPRSTLPPGSGASTSRDRLRERYLGGWTGPEGEDKS
jgi:fatty-acyl-CoA synthase